MIRAVADTHAIIWYLAGSPRLSPTALAAIEGAIASLDQIAISSMSLVEIVFLMERSRIDPLILDRILALFDRNEFLVEVPIDSSIVLAMRGIDRTQVPELPDRVIAATAIRYGVPLISRDGKIKASGMATIW